MDTIVATHCEKLLVNILKNLNKNAAAAFPLIFQFALPFLLHVIQPNSNCCLTSLSNIGKLAPCLFCTVMMLYSTNSENYMQKNQKTPMNSY